MIRPVPYVDLPGIVYALDRWMRARNGEYANFVIAPAYEEPRSSLAALVSAIWPFTPNALTWICEDRWHPLGVAQARTRPGSQAWDLLYLAAMSAPGGQPPSMPQDDVLLELVQYALNAAMMRGIHRFFAALDDERPELELFSKMGFQRYARELTYWLPSARDAIETLPSTTKTLLSDSTPPLPVTAPAAPPAPPAPRLPRLRTTSALLERNYALRPEIPLRGWHHHDAWGLLRLYDACTPRRVQIAEGLTSDEFVSTRAGGGRTWYMPLVEPRSAAFVHDRGVRLGGWIRLRFGRGVLPHQLWVMAHPDEPDVPQALVRFGLRLLAADGPRPVVCQVREYEGNVVDALRAAGFEHCGTQALLVRHLTMRALAQRDVPAVESRVVYGVRGLGTAQTRLAKGKETHYATSDH
ncbi:MAG: hypothetical protein ACRDHP_15170 [Ktedonobacterales bacterium]